MFYDNAADAGPAEVAAYRYGVPDDEPRWPTWTPEPLRQRNVDTGSLPLPGRTRQAGQPQQSSLPRSLDTVLIPRSSRPALSVTTSSPVEM